ncbi:hypothetical protein ACKKBG_A10520 [Auxenochlorella protothecoides x Auxenochlorella symbiontica]
MNSTLAVSGGPLSPGTWHARCSTQCRRCRSRIMVASSSGRQDKTSGPSSPPLKTSSPPPPLPDEEDPPVNDLSNIPRRNILLSMLAGTVAWWWLLNRDGPRTSTARYRSRTVLQAEQGGSMMLEYHGDKVPEGIVIENTQLEQRSRGKRRRILTFQAQTLPTGEG